MKLPFLTLLSTAALLAPGFHDAHARTPQGEAGAPVPLNSQLFYGALVISDSAKRNLLATPGPDTPLLPSLVPEGLNLLEFKHRLSPLRPEPLRKPEIPEPSGRNQPVPAPTRGTQRL